VPRVKLIRHGLDDHGNDCWGFPIYPWGECPHPRTALRFDPRFPAPVSCYCRACGEAYIAPYHGMTLEQIAAAKQRGREACAALALGDRRQPTDCSAHAPAHEEA
jgi:hypothetical protein